MKVLFIGDIHGNFKLTNERIKGVVGLHGNPDLIVQVGDFGFYPKGEGHGTLTNEYIQCEKYFIRGNHEDHSALPLANSTPEVVGYGAWKYVPDGYFRDGIFFCGGAYSIDRSMRQFGPYKYHENEELSVQEERIIFDRFMEVKDEVRCVVTHDCPNDIYNLVITGKDRFPQATTPKFLNHIAEELKSRDVHWIFGHHHKRREMRMGSIKFHLLNMLTHEETQCFLLLDL